MGILQTILSLPGRLWRSLENPRVPLDPWHQAAGGGLEGDLSSAGVRVGESKSLTVAAFWRGVSLISRTVAKLPLGVQRNTDPGREPDRDHPADYLLRLRPNDYMTPFVYKQLAMYHVLLRGNAYSYVFRRGDGAPLDLLPLDPARTHPIRVNGTLWYVHELKGGEKRKLHADDVLHLKGLSGDGLEGFDVLHKARETLGLAIATTAYGGTFFRNSARPNVLLKHPGRLTPEARRNLRESWERIHAGLDNAHKTAILEEGMDVAEVQINARDAQLLESKQFGLIDVANWLNLPPNRLGANISTSYKSLEQDNQNYLDDAIDPWLVAIEEECEAKLLTEAERRAGTHAIAVDRFPLIRADIEQRGKFYTVGLQAGFLSPDEVRAREGLNPMPGGMGQVYFRPLNLGTVGGDPVGPGVAPGAELLDLPDVRQSQAWDCGPAAVNAVLGYLERDAVTPAQLGTTPERGTSPAQVLALLARLGVAATAKAGLTVDDLSRFFRAGQPVLCPCRPPEAPGGPWLAVSGTGLGQVMLHDPMSGRRMMSEEAWLECWHDLDADGNAYDRFGIAVGEELPPPADGEEEDEPADPSPAPAPEPDADDDPAPEDEGRARVLLATERALGEALCSVVRLVAKQAERAAKEPGSFLAWLDGFLDSRALQVAERMLSASLAAWRAAADSKDKLDVAKLLLGELRAGLLDVSGHATPGRLRGAVVAYFLRIESDVWGTKTARALRGTTDDDEH